MMKQLTCKKCSNSIFSFDSLTTCHACGATGADVEVKDVPYAIVAQHNDILELRCRNCTGVSFFNYISDRKFGDALYKLWDDLTKYRAHQRLKCPCCGGDRTTASWIFAAIAMGNGSETAPARYPVEAATPNK